MYLSPLVITGAETRQKEPPLLTSAPTPSLVGRAKGGVINEGGGVVGEEGGRVFVPWLFGWCNGDSCSPRQSVGRTPACPGRLGGEVEQHTVSGCTVNTDMATAHEHTQTDTLTHTHKHTYTKRHTHIHTHTSTQRCRHTHICKDSCSRADTEINSQKVMRLHSQI